MPFVELPHTADLRIKVFAKTLKDLFIESFKALYTIIFGKNYKCTGKERGVIRIEGEDVDILLHDFLDEILYITLVKEQKICSITIKTFKPDEAIECEFYYIKLNREEIKKEVKAITYHNLHVIKNKDTYETEVVMDV